jgi:SP family facilitated glucose transporter-like MFS transporter 8
MGDEPLLQKVKIQEDIESVPLLQKVKIQEDIESVKGIRVNNDGEEDGPVTLILLFTTFTALCGTFSYGTAVIFFIFSSFFLFSMFFLG